MNEEQAIGRFDESLQRLYMEYAKGQHGSWKDLQISLKGRDFFRAGPLMRALEYDKPCVLLIDELDKVDEGFEALLLRKSSPPGNSPFPSLGPSRRAAPPSWC